MNLQGITSGDSTTAHVFAVSAIGQACQVIAVWALSLGHIPVPDNVGAAGGVIFSVVVSWLMQKIG